jgi:hypothetical protein
MATKLTAAEAQQSLTEHVREKGMAIHAKYGPQLGWQELNRILNDRSCVRYPCEISFDSSLLQDGEMAHPTPKGERPEEGFIIHVHPLFMTQLDRVAWLVLYQLVLVNYGEFASVEDAETFGASALGVTQDEYYAELCQLADQMSPEDSAAGCGG